MESLKKLSNCGICLEYMDSPRILKCHHSFCKSCLSALYNSDHNQRYAQHSRIKCPKCRMYTPLNAGGIPELPSDFRHTQLDDLLQELKTNQKKFCNVCVSSDEGSIQSKLAQHCCTTCGDMLCESCSQKHKEVLIFSKHELLPLNMKEELGHNICPIHQTKTMEYFCYTCKKVVCSSCITYLHTEHSVVDGPTRVKHQHAKLNLLRRRINDKIQLTTERSYHPVPNGFKYHLNLAVQSVEKAIKQHVKSTINDIKKQEEGLLMCLEKKKARMRESTDPEILRQRKIWELTALDKFVENMFETIDYRDLINGVEIDNLERTVDVKLKRDYPSGYFRLPKSLGKSPCVAFSPGPIDFSVGTLRDCTFEDMKRDIY